MGVKSTKRVAQINNLEMKHMGDVHEIDLINRDEETRRIKLRLLALRDENATLKDRLQQRDARLNLVEQQGDEVRVQLDEARKTAKQQEARAKSQAKELTNLKAELESVNTSIQDSNKTLQEKFSLERRLNRIEPEMDHLKSQLANHQAVVAEKHDLQRQLDSLEVELASEKRQKQRSRQTEADAEWKSKFEDAEQKHASEKKEWQKTQKEMDRELREAQGEGERLEERLSTMKLKLKSVQTELKETNAELESCRAELEAAKKAAKAGNLKATKSDPVKAQPGKKRRANDLSFEDVSIGTPGPDEAAMKRLAKKRGVERAAVGAKSTFSITPFLNKTRDISDDSIDISSPTAKTATTVSTGLAIEEEDEEEEEEQEEEEQHQSEAEALAPIDESLEAEEPAVEVPVEKKKPGRPRGRPKKALNEAPVSKKNIPPQVSNRLESVSEEPEAAHQQENAAHRARKGLDLKAKAPEPRVGLGSLNAANASAFDDGKKKKRKLLAANKTIFDDEDGVSPAPRPPKVQLGGARRLKGPLGGVASSFGGTTFSPLKRDRRGVGASFLQ